MQDIALSLGLQATDEVKVSSHAAMRMNSRRLPGNSIEVAMQYGREVYIRGAFIYAVGKREIERAQRVGANLRSYAGLQVVCLSTGLVLTAYKNQNFRGLKPKSRRRSFHVSRGNTARAAA